MNIVFDKKIQDFLNFCNDNNINLYLVGGAIRDYLMNNKSYDLDFALVSDYKIALSLLNKHYNCKSDDKYQSLKFSIDEYNLEISHARKERDYLDYRHPSTIEFTNDLMIDSKRRDFTINALYYKDNEIYDFYNGLEDLKNHKLKVIGDTLTRFKEDPLRILRMIRFTSLGFEISEIDKKIILDNSYLLKELTLTSFNKEFDKILQLNNLYIFYEYKSLFEDYFEIKFKSLEVLAHLNNNEEKKTYLGIKNKSNLYKYKDVFISDNKIELTKLIYKLSKEVVYELVNYYDKVNNTKIIDIYNKIISEDFYDKRQLQITSKEIIDLVKKEELTSYYLDKISYSIIEGKLENQKDKIIEYILECKR